MVSRSQNLFWPYDEVQISESAHSLFLLATPWLKFQFQVPEESRDDLLKVIDKLKSQSISPQDINLFDRVFASFAEYPVSYLLPRQQPFGSDKHFIIRGKLNLNSPLDLLNEIIPGSKYINENLPLEWTWDADVALEFSKTPEGFDPVSLFSVLRRFHLLNDLENNRTNKLFEYIMSMPPDSTESKKASALVLRQNHYVTLRCEEVLSSALNLAQGAEENIRAFIQEENGHDKIIGRAISSLGIEPEQIQVSEVSVYLMDGFKFIGQKNLLAFSAVVDVFERTSYRKEDPFATVLKTGGFNKASKLVDAHREINDHGHHENVALAFLKNMKVVDEDYAREALRLAELNTMIINQHSKELLEIIN